MVGAVQLRDESHDLVFVSSDAQLLRFPASAVRPQGRLAGGMAGIRLSPRASAVWFGAVDPAGAGPGAGDGSDGASGPGGPGGPVVVTVAGSAGALPGTAAGSVKVSPYAEFPPKGRATGGVRCHRFLKGEDELILAWAGPGPALGATEAGGPVRAAGAVRPAGRLGGRPEPAAGRRRRHPDRRDRRDRRGPGGTARLTPGSPEFPVGGVPGGTAGGSDGPADLGGLGCAPTLTGRPLAVGSEEAVATHQAGVQADELTGTAADRPGRQHPVIAGNVILVTDQADITGDGNPPARESLLVDHVSLVGDNNVPGYRR